MLELEIALCFSMVDPHLTSFARHIMIQADITKREIDAERGPSWDSNWLDRVMFMTWAVATLGSRPL